jgi:hypothetical protein
MPKVWNGKRIFFTEPSGSPVLLKAAGISQPAAKLSAVPLHDRRCWLSEQWDGKPGCTITK